MCCCIATWGLPDTLTVAHTNRSLFTILFVKISKFKYYDGFSLIDYNSLQISIKKVTKCTAALLLDASPTNWQLHT